MWYFEEGWCGTLLLHFLSFFSDRQLEDEVKLLRLHKRDTQQRQNDDRLQNQRVMDEWRTQVQERETQIRNLTTQLEVINKLICFNFFSENISPPSLKYHTTIFKVPHHHLQNTTPPSLKYHTSLFKVPHMHCQNTSK